MSILNLPKSYDGGMYISDGDGKGGMAHFHFTNLAEGEAWFEAVTETTSLPFEPPESEPFIPPIEDEGC